MKILLKSTEIIKKLPAMIQTSSQPRRIVNQSSTYHTHHQKPMASLAFAYCKCMREWPCVSHNDHTELPRHITRTVNNFVDNH